MEEFHKALKQLFDDKVFNLFLFIFFLNYLKINLY
jgi:hypothetical protein